MPISYDQKSDTLTITLSLDAGIELFEYEAGDFTVLIDELDQLATIKIAKASRFVAQALAAGVEVEKASRPPSQKQGMIWYDADSSMISAYGYDAAEEILEVAFHRTGVYRYYDVPADVFEGLQQASSKGRYMRGHIIDMYPYEKKRGR